MTDLTATNVAPKPAKKRLALFLDGTWNSEGDNTNVWRMRSLCAKTGTDGLPQAIYYNSGVGTRALERVRGGLFGAGLDRNIIDAYQWLVETYEPGDDIFIVGFSRGAYTARSLAGFITKCGLLKPGAPLGVNELFIRYRSAPDSRTIRGLAGLEPGTLSLQERWLLKHAQAIPVAFVGVWDTVGSLGIPFGRLQGISRSSFGFLSTGLYQSIQSAYQALAIDEHRPDFMPTLWTKRIHHDGRPAVPDRPLTDVEQRWFCGAHANVGGGYPGDMLAQIPLRWLMSKASQHGLAFREEVEPDPAALSAPITDSYGDFLWGKYRWLPGRRAPYQRTIGMDPVREPDAEVRTVNETIDGSVFDKRRQDTGYRPMNLEMWAAAHATDLETARGPVAAATGASVPP